MSFEYIPLNFGRIAVYTLFVFFFTQPLRVLCWFRCETVTNIGQSVARASKKKPEAHKNHRQKTTTKENKRKKKEMLLSTCSVYISGQI